MSSSLTERFEGIRSIISYFNTADDTERTDLLRRLEAIAALRWRDIDRVKATDYALVVMLAIPAAVGWLTSKPIDWVVAELSRLHSADPDIIPSSKVLGSTLFYPLSWIGLIVGFGTAISVTSALYVAVSWPVSLLARVHITWPLRRLWGSFFRRRQLHREPGWGAELSWLRDLARVSDGDRS